MDDSDDDFYGTKPKHNSPPLAHQSSKASSSRTATPDSRRRSPSSARTKTPSPSQQSRSISKASSKPPVHSRSDSRSASDSDSDAGSSRVNKESKSISNRPESRKKIIEAKIPVATSYKSDSDHSDNEDAKYGDESFESASESENEEKHSIDRTAKSNDTKNSNRKSQKTNASSKGSIVKKSVKSENYAIKKTEQSKRNHHSKLPKNSDDSASASEASDMSDNDSDITKVSSMRASIDKNSTKPSYPRPGKNKKTITTNDINRLRSGELNALLQTVLDLDRETQRADQRSGEGRRGELIYYPRRKNYTFSNDRVKAIERENQRVLRSIIDQADGAQKAKRNVRETQATWTPLRRPTSASINRIRNLQRIEGENLALLKRLQGTQPSKSIQRDALISDYERQQMRKGALLMYPAPSRAPSRPQSGHSSMYSSGTGSRVRHGVIRDDRKWNDRW